MEGSTDDEVMERCKKEVRYCLRCLLRILNTFQTNCGDCDPLVWLTPTNNVRMNPPENTVVVVDVRGNQGAIRIVDKKDNKYVDGIGTEETKAGDGSLE